MKEIVTVEFIDGKVIQYPLVSREKAGGQRMIAGTFELMINTSSGWVYFPIINIRSYKEEKKEEVTK